MSNSILNDNVASQLASQSDAIGRLAQDSGGFSAVIAAFESKDPNAFRWVLDRLEMLPYCELICEWVRIKFGVLRCLEVCGVPNEELGTPNLQQFARAIVRLASNEALLRRIVDAVACGNGDDYRAAVAELNLNDFCYLLCHWIYSVIYYRVCEVVCSPARLLLGDPVSEIRAAAKGIAGLLENEKAFDAMSQAAVALNCEPLKSIINQFGLGSQCGFICRLICSWHYVWVCREFCQLRTPVLTGSYGIEEARNFALASRQFASQPRALADLVTAVQNRDTKSYGAILDRFGLGPYCYQVCAWVGSLTCHEFCICVCPPAYPPAFTQVGLFEIYSEIDPTTGLTSTSQPPSPKMPYGGGPNFAFYEQLQLTGYCPIYSPTDPGVQMMYRFLYSTVATSLAVGIDATQTFITVAPGAPLPATGSNISVCNNGTPSTNETAEIMTVTSTAGTTWNVKRAQEGTTAAPSPAGALVGLNPTPITGNLVSPVQWIGTRPYAGLWPTNLAGIAGPSVSGWSEAVWVVPNNYQPPAPSPNPGTVPPDPPPPTLGATWYPPVHYITPDANGWVPVDEDLSLPSVSVLLGFDTTQPGVVPGGCELTSGSCFGGPGGAPAGTAVPSGNQEIGTDLTIIFQATRVTVPTPADYSNSLCRIHVNNWVEVNNLWLVEFGSGSCCNPIDTTLSVEFTVDHEMMSSGEWSLEITSTSGGTTCSPSAPGLITPTVSSLGPPPVTVTSRGGSGTIVENTTAWVNCSYQVLQTARAGLTTGLADNDPGPNQLTFCICGHGNLPVLTVEGQSKKQKNR
jgi:hypothetical protein